MHQQNNRYYELAEKWLNGTITKEELGEFSEWYNTYDDVLDIPEEFAKSEDDLHKRILAQIKGRKRRTIPVKYLKRPFLIKLAAASILVIVGMLSLFYFLDKEATVHENSIVGSSPKKDSVLPGGNKAILILGDGTKLVLDTVSSGTIAENTYTKVIKLDDGQLAYSSSNEANTPVTYNTLSTPKGGQYAITLTDGTRVWLNSASSLRFPSSFINAERMVELTGEGYFEVAHDVAKPFLVKVNGMEVKVLGTHFNIMAYSDESSMNTTLITGSVSIQHQYQTALLIPGQQAQAKQNGKIRIVKNADVEQAIAWKNGVFNFNGSDIETTMRQIARWYDIDVTYEGKITEHFNGTIVRKASIEKVLQMLEYTGVVSFSMQGRKIRVRQQ